MITTRAIGAGVVLLLVTGCGQSGVAPGGDAGAGPGGGPPLMTCPPGERELADGSCVAAGVQDDGCAAGTRMVDGGCQAAGIPANGCGPGFVHDGDVGCSVILPATPCAAGTRAVPGDTQCRGFDACGSDVYPVIPAGRTVVHVDASYTPGNGDGTASKPYRTIQEAVDAAPDGAVVAIAAGAYAEDVSVQGKALTLWGRCGDMVSLEAQAVAALSLGPGADGSVVRGLAIQGNGIGVSIVGAQVQLDEVWIHDTSDWGVSVLRDTTPASIDVREVLIEGASERGIYAEGSDVVIDRSVVRDTQLPAVGSTARALNLRDSLLDGAPSQAVVTTSLFEGGHEVAIMVHASNAQIANSLIRNVLPSAQGRFGRGIGAQLDASSSQPPMLSVTQSNVENVVDGGITVSGGVVSLDAVVVRDVAANLDEGMRGYAVVAQYVRATDTTSQLTLRNSLLERAHESALFITGSESLLEGVVIRDGEPVEPIVVGPPSLFGGRGINIQNDPMAGSQVSATLSGCLVDRTTEAGILLEGATVLIQGTLVRDTAPVGVNFGRGINIQDNLSDAAQADVTVRASVVEGATEVGVFAQGSRMALEGTLVVGTRPRSDGEVGAGVDIEIRPETSQRGRLEVSDSEIRDCFWAGIMGFGSDIAIDHSAIRSIGASQAVQDYGDGVAILDIVGPPVATIRQSLIAQVARAGASSFGGELALESTAIECAPIDLASEQSGEQSATVTDLGANRCACNGQAHECKALSSSLAPPKPLPSGASL